MFLRTIIIYWLLLVSCCSSFAQQPDAGYTMQYYTVADGLTGNDVVKTLTDKKGFLWIATHNGISRFDGREFKNYSHIPGDTTTLRSIWVTDMIIDKTNTLWATTEWGICYYDPAYDRFRYITPKDSITILYKSPLTMDKNGDLWLAAESGLYKIETAGKIVIPTSLKRIADPQCVTEDAMGNLIIGTRGDGVYYYERATGLTEKINTPGIDPKAHYMNALHYKDEVWLATSEGMVEIQDKKKSFLHAGVSPGLPVNEGFQLWSFIFYPVKNTHYFLCCTYDRRIVLFDIEKKIFVPRSSYVKQLGKDLFGAVVYDLHQQAGITWLSTQRGLYKIAASIESFYPVNNNFTTKDSLPLMIQNIRQDIKNKDRYLLFSRQDNGTLLFYDHIQQVVQKRIYNKGNPDEEIKDYSYLLQDSAGTIYTFGGRHITIYSPDGVWQKEINTGKIIMCACFDEKGNIWMGTGDGLSHYNLSSGNIINYDCHFTGTDVERTSMSLSFFTTGVASAENTIWATSNKYGLFSFDKKTFQFTPHRQAFTGLYETLNRCSGLVLSNDKIWISNMAGLTSYDIRNDRFVNYNISHGLQSTYIYSVCKTEGNIIWGRGNMGLFSFDPSTENFENYALPASLNASYFLQKTFADKEFCLLGLPGKFARFQKRIKVIDKLPVFLNRLVSGNSPVIVNSYQGEIPFAFLSHSQNDLRIDFTTPDFSGEPLYYSYMFSGIDEDWINAGEKHEVNYFNLAPGEYTFTVKCRKGEEDWGIPQTLLTVKIEAAFWQRLWFKLLIALILAGVLYVFYKKRIRQVRKRQIEKNYQQQLQIEKYKQELELEQITGFFSGSLINKNNTNEVLNEVAKNLIGKLGFEDCMIYLWNDDKTKLIQRAGYGIKGEVENLQDTEKYNIEKGKGIIGAAVELRKPLIVNDTTKDDRYINADNQLRRSELCVPLLDEGQAIGAINIEQTEKNHFTPHHQQMVSAIAAMMVNKLKAVQSTQSLYQKELELSKTSRQLAETELAMLRSQMNPHFIFNSLNSVQKYIWENKEEDAAEYLAQFAKLMRAILENSRKNFITLREEIDTMKIYTELEHRRSNGRFNYTIRIAEDIDPEKITIPPMLLQPFIENAVWHGLSKKNEKGNLVISVHKEADQLICIVDDDGVGRVEQKETRSGKRSLGIEITRQRIESLMHNSGRQPSIIITDKKQNGEPAGTKVTITLPLQTI